MKKQSLPLIILGASGHACVAADIAMSGTQFFIAGFVDRDPSPHQSASFGPFLGVDHDIANALAQTGSNHVFVAIGNNWIRQEVVARVRRSSPQICFPPLVHPSAVVASSSQIMEGAMVCAGAVVGTGATLGAFSIVNTRASLDHHASLGDFASLAPAAATGGDVTIGEGTAIGIGVLIHHGISIGAWSVLGSGSLANRDIAGGVLAYGSPARVIRARNPSERYL